MVEFVDLTFLAGGIVDAGIVFIIGAILAYFVKKFTIKVCDSFNVKQSKLLGSVVFWAALLTVLSRALIKIPEFTDPTFVSMYSIGTTIDAVVGMAMGFALPFAIVIAVLIWKKK